MTASRDSIRRRNQAIVEDFYERGQSYSALEETYGLTLDSIKKIIKQDRIQNGERARKIIPEDPRKIKEQPPLMFDHFAMGVHLTRYMEANELTNTEAGVLLCMSRVDIGKMCSGRYDITWTQMIKLRELLGLTHDQLLTVPLKEHQ